MLIEVALENGRTDTAKLSERSQLDVESVLANDECSELGLEEISNTADNKKFYEVEEIINVRLNRSTIIIITLFIDLCKNIQIYMYKKLSL